MTLHFRVQPAFLLLLISACAYPLSVRVLLDEQKLPALKEWVIESPEGFLCFAGHNPSTNPVVFSETMSIKIQHNFIVINKKKCITDQIKIVSQNGIISFGAKKFQGSLLLLNAANTWYLINELDLEDYICSVLRSESWPGWPLEVNKAFAVASRSYFLAKMFEAKKRKRPYHVKCTNSHQTYNGIAQIKEVHQQAVAQTKGLILTHRNIPIEAMFDVCCGGIIPAHVHGFSFSAAPYLARTYPCTFCKSSKLYQWQQQFLLKEIEALLQKEFKHIKRLLDVKVIKKDKAGLVQKVSIQSTGGSYTLTGKKLYSLLKKIKSFSFSITKKGQAFTISGLGYGHHMGLCQWGARAMIDEGCGYREVLAFYYPGTVLKELLLKKD